MGLFNKPLLPAHYENEDVQISAELCTNIAIRVVGNAKGEITILSGNEDMIQIKTSVQAKESIIKNAAALEPHQDGSQYTYTIHTPTEERLGKSCTFQVFVTIPRQLESLESFTIEGTNLSLSVGNIAHTFIKNLRLVNARGDITVESFYGECATILNSIYGAIQGKYSVARLYANAKGGRIAAKVHLLNTADDLPNPKVICTTMNHPVDVDVDGTDLFGPFAVEAKTQCRPLDVKILLASTEQRLLGNFINFGGPTKIRLSGNYQGRIETRTHYGKIFIDEPEFERIEGATLSLPSLSDRKGSPVSSSNISMASGASSSASSTHEAPASHVMSSRTSSSQSTTMSSWDHPNSHPLPPSHNPAITLSSVPGTASNSGNNSRAVSINGSMNETRSMYTAKSIEKQRRKEEEKDSVVTREMIGTIGHGSGLVMAKNSSGDITVSLI
ncbi:hypothetical protein BGZ93_002164 [Podila epicladia]|nr:hypothetical protein BGZ93_002164 [Podila epicladia]KAG0085318.1 hypothetical protein BGZ92_009089 [Podila epicladia]